LVINKRSRTGASEASSGREAGPQKILLSLGWLVPTVAQCGLDSDIQHPRKICEASIIFNLLIYLEAVS
jgi:hypothetical protein